MDLTKFTELLALPKWGLVSHQFPDFAANIASSSKENNAIVALLLIPPANTASAIKQIILYTSTVLSFSPECLLSKILVILVIHSLKGPGPGATPPDVNKAEPLGLIWV